MSDDPLLVTVVTMGVVMLFLLPIIMLIGLIADDNNLPSTQVVPCYDYNNNLILDAECVDESNDTEVLVSFMVAAFVAMIFIIFVTAMLATLHNPYR